MASSNIGNPTFNYDVNGRATLPAANTNPTYSNVYDVTGNRGTVGTNVSPLDPNVRVSTNYTNANQVNVPVTGTTSSNFAPGAIAATTLQRYTTSPPTGNLQASGNYSTYNSYSNPININTAASGPAAPTTHITTSGYHAQPNNIIKTQTENHAIRASQQNYESRIGAQPTGGNSRNLAGASSVHNSAGSSSCNWKTLGLIGLGLCALAGILVLVLFFSGNIGRDQKADFNPPQNTTVTTQTTVVDNSTSANTTTTTNETTYPAFNTTPTNKTNGTTTNGTTNTTTNSTPNTATTAPTTAGQTITYPTNSTTGTTSVTTNATTSGTTNGTTSGSGSGTASGTTTVSTTATTTPTSGTTATGTTTIAQTTPTFTLVFPKHNLMRKYVD